MLLVINCSLHNGLCLGGLVSGKALVHLLLCVMLVSVLCLARPLPRPLLDHIALPTFDLHKHARPAHLSNRAAVLPLHTSQEIQHETADAAVSKMCLPCWPVKDIYLEDDPPHQSVHYAWDGGKWVQTVRPSRSVSIEISSLSSHS